MDLSRPLVRVVPSLFAALLAACGGNDSTGPGDGGEDPVASVTVSPQTATVPVGGSVRFAATARDAQGQVVSASPTWSVAPGSVASMNSDGLATGLQDGSATVTATVQGRTGAAQLVVEPLPEPPAAPSGLTAAPASPTEIFLEWTDDSDDEAEFRIERSTGSPDAWTALASVPANTTAYTDPGLDEDTRYFYRVAAAAEDRVSDWSNVAEATTPTGTGATVVQVEAVIDDVLPPPETPLAQRDLLEEVQAVAAGLAALPAVDTVVVLERVLAAQTLFEDGTMHLFINNRPAGADAAAAGDPGAAVRNPGLPTSPTASLRSSRRPAPAAVDGPPGSPRAVVTSFDGGADVAGEVAQMLGTAGYEVLSLGASLDDMRQYKNLGVLHLDTHGVAFKRLRRLEDGSVEESQAFGLQTSTVVGTDLGAYSAELQDGSLLISTFRDEQGNTRTTFAITEVFIAKHWSLDDGVVMLHACHGGAGPFPTDDGDGPVVDPSILRLTMLGAGAKIVVAYDNLTWTSFARPTILHFFDRLLGADSYDPEDPPLRPFDVDEVKADMQERGLLQFTRPEMIYLGVIPWGGNEVNVVFDVVPGRTTLAPSIRTVDVVDDVAQGTGELTLRGLFGADEGTVEAEGVSLAVESWSNTSIVARAPFQGGGSAGPVVVKRPDDVESNEVPLTEWRGTVTVSTKTVGSLEAEATLDVRFRADVHAFREGIRDDPEHRTVETYISPASSGTNKGSGSYTQGSATETWFGSYDMQMLTKQHVDTGVFPLTSSVMGGKVTLDPDGGKAEICLGVWGQIGVRVQTPQGTTESTGYATFIVPTVVDRMKGLFGCVDADLDDDTFWIDGDNRSSTTENAEFTLEWSEFVPVSAPDGETAG